MYSEKFEFIKGMEVMFLLDHGCWEYISIKIECEISPQLYDALISLFQVFILIIIVFILQFVTCSR